MIEAYFDFVLKSKKCKHSFPSIVGSGKNVGGIVGMVFALLLSVALLYVASASAIVREHSALSTLLSHHLGLTL